MLCEDLAQLLFPRVEQTPSEAMQSSVRLMLQRLVRGIEIGLGIDQEGSIPKSWDILCRSGLLREQALMEFALARIAEERISSRINEGKPDIFNQIAAQMLGNKDPTLVQVARNLLIAESAIERLTPDNLVRQMPADLLHLALWRVVAVFQSGALESRSNCIEAGNRLLSAHDESLSVGAAAAKLVYFLPDDIRPELNNPRIAGLSLYVGGLASEFRLSHDRVLRFIDEEPVAPFMVLLSARGTDATSAMSILQYMRGERSDDYRLPILLEQYEDIDAELARSTILKWRLGADKIGVAE